MEKIVLQVWAVLIIGFVFVAYMVYAKAKYSRQAKNNAQTLIRNSAGRWGLKTLPIVSGLLRLPPKKEGEAGKTFAINHESAPDCLYPLNKWSFLQTTIPMAVFDEENWEPLSNVGQRPVLPSGLLDVMKNESWSDAGIRLAVETGKKQEEVGLTAKKKSNVAIFWVLGGVAVIAALVYLWTRLQAIEPLLGM